MTNWMLMVPYLRKWEGGLSDDPNDPAHVSPAPGVKWHTNAGVTWPVFRDWCTVHHIEPTTALFEQMPAEIWGGIMKERFWQPMMGDFIASQAIAELVVDFAWGSGSHWATLTLQRVLVTFGQHVALDGTMGNETLNALNSLLPAHERALFYGILVGRHKFCVEAVANGVALWPIYGTGWGNRLNDFERTHAHAAGWLPTGADWTQPIVFLPPIR